jgi:hypothetical protein
MFRLSEQDVAELVRSDENLPSGVPEPLHAISATELRH